MKRIIVGMLSILLIALFGGCGGDEEMPQIDEIASGREAEMVSASEEIGGEKETAEAVGLAESGSEEQASGGDTYAAFPLYLQEIIQHKTVGEMVTIEEYSFYGDEEQRVAREAVKRVVEYAVEELLKDYPDQLTSGDVNPLLRRFEILDVVDWTHPNHDPAGEMVVYAGLVSARDDLEPSEEWLYIFVAYQNDEILDIAAMNGQTGEVALVDSDLVRDIGGISERAVEVQRLRDPAGLEHSFAHGYIRGIDLDNGLLDIEERVWVTLEDADMIAALGLNPDDDMPGGFHIHDPGGEPKAYAFSERTEFYILHHDWQPLLKLDALEFARIDFQDKLFVMELSGDEAMVVTQAYVP